MAGIINNTARQFNLKGVTPDGQRVTVRLAPGFNVVNEAHWGHFIRKGKDAHPYVKQLKKLNLIDFGPKVDDLEMEQDPDTKSKSKLTPAPPKAKAKGDEKAETEDL